MENKKKFTWLGLLGIILLYLAGCWYTYGFYVDDAFISLQYAKNLANHGILTFNLGDAPVEGYTNFLLILIEALFIKLGVQSVLNIPKLVNIAAGVGLILFTYGFSLKILKTDNMFLKFLPAIAVATSTPIIYWTVGGLESTLFAMLVLGGVYYFAQSLDHDNLKNRLLPEFFFLLATLCRPEGLIFWGAGYLYLLINFKKYDLAKRLKYFAVYVIGLAVYLGWKYYYFEGLLPMSYYSKVMPRSFMLFYGGVMRYFDFLKINFNFVYFVLFLFTGYIALKRKKAVMSYVFIQISIFSLYLASLGPSVFMDHLFRIHIPIIPLIYIAGTYGLEQGMTARNMKLKTIQYVVISFCILQIVGGGLKVYDAWYNNGDWGQENLSIEKSMAGYDWVPVVKWLKEKMPSEASIAMGDIGMMGYYSDFRIIDTFSLVNKPLVQMWKKLSETEYGTPAYLDLISRMVKYVFDQDPEMIHLRYLDFSIDQRAQNYILVETNRPDTFGGLFVRKDLADRFKIIDLDGKPVTLDMIKQKQ